jgi:hypothetical protein
MADFQQRTQFAMRALDLADIFKIKVGDRLVGMSTRYRPELSAPEGQSTGGGKQAVQHITLVPSEGDGPVLVAGSANAVDKVAELRSYEHMEQLHARRFKGKVLPLDRGPYMELLQRLQIFFAEQRISVVFTQPTPEVAPAPRNQMGVILLLVGIAVAVGGALFFVLSMKH